VVSRAEQRSRLVQSRGSCDILTVHDGLLGQLDCVDAQENATCGGLGFMPSSLCWLCMYIALRSAWMEGPSRPYPPACGMPRGVALLVRCTMYVV
jgi:hypothetical protein